MPQTDLPRYNHSVGFNVHHFEWCTKYRYKMFMKEKYKRFAENALREIAERHSIEIWELSVMPEHIHVMANLPHTMFPSNAPRLLKDATPWVMQRLM